MYESVDEQFQLGLNRPRIRPFLFIGVLIKQKELEFMRHLGEPNFKASTERLDNWKRRFVHRIYHKIKDIRIYTKMFFYLPNYYENKQ